MSPPTGCVFSLIVMIAILFCEEVLTTTLIRQDLTDYDLARCNDGSAAAYFYQQDIGLVGSDVLLYLPDGGSCGTLTACSERCGEPSRPYEGCTAPDSQVLERTGGIWSDDGLVNPFSHHWKVVLHYCSSDNYAGTRGASSSTGNLYFHGKHILTAALDDLSTRFGLENARSLTLLGTGSGARGVGFNCDYVASLLPGVEVKCIADSPDMVPYWVTTDDCGRRDYEKEETERILWGREEDESCLQHNKAEVNSSELAHLCGVWSRYWTYIDTPFYILGSQLDAESVSASTCLPGPTDPTYEEFELAWRRGITALYESMLAGTEEARGQFFVPDCRLHSFLSGDLVDSRLGKLRVPSLHGNQTISLFESLSGWLNDSAPLQAIDGVAAGNTECPGPAPLCRSNSCGTRRSFVSYPSVRRRLLPPPSLFPQNYHRRCCLDPWFDYGGGAGAGGLGIQDPFFDLDLGHAGHGVGVSRGRGNPVGFPGGSTHPDVLQSDKRKRLWRRLIYLQYLRRLYQQQKVDYARDYYGYDGYDGYDGHDGYYGHGLDPVYHGGRIPNLGLKEGRTPSLLYQLLGSDYSHHLIHELRSAGLLAGIEEVIRLRVEENPAGDERGILRGLEQEFEDFGPLSEQDETSPK